MLRGTGRDIFLFNLTINGTGVDFANRTDNVRALAKANGRREEEIALSSLREQQLCEIISRRARVPPWLVSVRERKLSEDNLKYIGPDLKRLRGTKFHRKRPRVADI